MAAENHPLLEVSHLKKYFQTKNKSVIKAVDDVSFTISQGETLGLVGESGCGKTTCGRTCIGLYPKTDGQVLYRGKDVHAIGERQRKAFTKQVQVIFQDPYSSLDPKMRVQDIVAEGILSHNLAPDRAARQEMVATLLEQVGLRQEHATRYVHEFSGGQRQRIGIARALAVDPEFILCDEPISALDVSIQAQIVNLLQQLQEQRGLTYLFIAHDLAMVRHISNRVAVMYLGRLVELSETEELYSHPAHPYTQALLAAIPIADPLAERQRQRQILAGEAILQARGEGCVFAGRCPRATQRCRQETPSVRQVAPHHFVACHLYD